MRAVRTEHAAVARLRTQYNTAAFAVEEEHTNGARVPSARRPALIEVSRTSKICRLDMDYDRVIYVAKL